MVDFLGAYVTWWIIWNIYNILIAIYNIYWLCHTRKQQPKINHNNYIWWKYQRIFQLKKSTNLKLLKISKTYLSGFNSQWNQILGIGFLFMKKNTTRKNGTLHPNSKEYIKLWRRFLISKLSRVMPQRWSLEV